jgi:hypothetical protein
MNTTADFLLLTKIYNYICTTIFKRKTMEQSNPIIEANRYIQNARQLLTDKAKKDGEYYNDSKYIKMAGHTAWCGVLVALDATLHVKEKMKKNQRPEIKDYIEAISKVDKGMPRRLLNAYETVHKILGYDGNLRYKIVQEGLEEAQDIIDWAENRY